MKLEEMSVDHCWIVRVTDSFVSQLWEVFQNKKALCGEWLSEIRIYVQVKNPRESYIILHFHLIQALVAYGRQTQESPVLKILALIALDCKIKQITLNGIEAELKCVSACWKKFLTKKNGFYRVTIFCLKGFPFRGSRPRQAVREVREILR